MFGRMFRAFDKATGAVVWETELPAGTTGAPITYMHQGKQYIVVAIGGREQAPELDRVRAAVTDLTPELKLRPTAADSSRAALQSAKASYRSVWHRRGI